MGNDRNIDDTGEMRLPPQAAERSGPATEAAAETGPRRRWRANLLAALLAALLIAAPAVFMVVTRDDGTAAGTRGAERSAPRGPMVGGGGATAQWPSWGMTHTQNTVPGDSGAAPQRKAVTRQSLAQVQAIMGWGADNPEPSPGRYDWRTLDSRVKLIRSTGGTPVITLCCSPDWMKGGTAGQTNWTQIEKAPSAARYDAFAELSAKVAQRYPDVKYFLVWNEFKGFWDPERNTWDAAGYTALYNKVYAALKKVNPQIRVGGPYIPVDSTAPGSGPPSDVSGSWGTVDPRVLEATRYWLKNKAGADFLVVDGASLPGRTGRPGESLAKVNEFEALAKFSAVTKWLREQSGDKLPVWWAEWYIQPKGSVWTDERLGAVQYAAMMEFVKGGASAAFYWSPQTTTSAECLGCLWSGTAAGNRGTPTLTMLQNFTRWFPPGTPLIDMASSNPAIRVLAQPKQMVTVNTTGRPAKTILNGKTLDLGPYEIRWIPL